MSCPHTAPPIKHSPLTVTVLTGCAGLRLTGEADLAGLDVLRSAIAVLPSGAQVIHLKLAALDFIDVCATRELVALAGRPSRPWVILHHPPRVLARLINLAWPVAKDRILIRAGWAR
jgi:hypothetical protein